MGRINKTDSIILDYCQQHHIMLLIDPTLKQNDGLCYPDLKEIHLSKKYSSSKIKAAAFFHEVGHIITDRLKKNGPYNLFDCEYYSWFEAIKLHTQLFKRSFNKEQADYMLKCLRTYCRSKHEFKKMVQSSSHDEE